MSIRILLLWLLGIFGAKCQINLNENEMMTVDCDRFLKDGHLFATCTFLIRAFMIDESNTGPYQSLTVSSTFKSLQPITDQSPFLTLQIVEGSVIKSSGSDDDISRNSQQSFTIASYFFFQAAVVNIFNMKMTCTNRSAIGLIHRRDCPFGLLNTTNLSDEEVLQCFDSVKILNNILAPFSDKPELTRSDVDNSQIPLKAMKTMEKFWLHDFGCIIDSFQIQVLFPRFPQELLLPQLNNISVRSLIFDRNYFGEVRDFPTLPLLETLSLSKCGISFIDSKAFRGLLKLETLDLSYNKLKSIPEVIQNIPKLHHLHLQFNELNLNSEFSFIWPPNLKSLNVSGNPIETRLLMSLNTTSRLETLDLSLCNISQISENTFPSLKSLSHLILNGNKLTNLSATMFRNLPHLKYLDLSRNFLKSFYRNSTEELHQLALLNLSNNAITGTEKTLSFYVVWKSLQSLDLSKNHLTSWGSSLFENLTQLQLLDLSFNNISALNPSMQTSLDVFNTTVFRLQNNDFDCDSCDLLSFQEWLQENSRRLEDGPEQYRCRFPAEKFGVPLMEALVNSDQCFPRPFQWMNKVVIPLIIILLLMTALASVLYYYKGHINYLTMYLNSRIRRYYNELEAENNFRFDAFISYASDDEYWILEYLIPEIENTPPPLKLFIRERDSEIGVQVVDAIHEAMDNCKKCIFLLSNNFLEDSFRKYEIEIALRKLKDNYRDVIILIRLDPVKSSQLAKDLRPVMTMRTYLDWPQDPQDQEARRKFWIKLRAAITGRVDTVL